MRNRPPHVFPQLYALASTGKVKVWRCAVEVIDDVPHIVREHGYMDGKIQRNAKPVPEGKNIGRANETIPWEQAISEAKALHQKQLDKNYRGEKPKPGEKPKTNLLPMLALTYEKAKHRLDWPIAAQPKLNGVRCLADNTAANLVYRTRTGKIWQYFDHLNEQILELDLPIGDGEIYKHGVQFQKLSSWCKKRHLETATLEFWIYDLAIEGVGFQKRHDILQERFQKVGELPHIKLVETVICRNESKFLRLHNRWVRQRYEGVIGRNLDGHYQFDFRSPDLQKYKEFEDAEFPIVGGHAGAGTHAGCCVFECRTPENLPFNCNAPGSLPERRRILKQLKLYIGKPLTVRFQEKSDDNIPIFPVGIAVRDYE